MTIKKYIPFIEKLRETVGYDFDLIHENNMRMNLEQVLEFAPTLETLKFLWLKEPISRYGRRSESGIEGAIKDHIKICKSLPTVKVSGGETMMTRFEFKEWIERDAYDIVQPDCCAAGGLSEVWKIATLANTWNIHCIPHVWGTGVAIAAGLHLLATLPDNPPSLTPLEPMLELDRTPNRLREETENSLVRIDDGNVRVPTKPGLGITLDHDFLNKFAVKSSF